MFEELRHNIKRTKKEDPAAKSTLMVLLCYPHIEALLYYRVANWILRKDFPLIARMLSTFARWRTGIEIHPGATIGRALFIDHGMGVVIGETTIIGDYVTLYHGVTLGGRTLNEGKRHPTVEDHVIIGTGAKVLGNITIGHHARVAPNVVLKESIPPYAVVYESEPVIRLKK